MNNINVSLTLNEAQVLVQLIDIAVKSQGLAAAEAGLVLTKKIQENMPQEQATGPNGGTDGSAGDQGGPQFASFPSGPSGASGATTGP
jgi:hypothetical protein